MFRKEQRIKKRNKKNYFIKNKIEVFLLFHL